MGRKRLSFQNENDRYRSYFHYYFIIKSNSADKLLNSDLGNR